MPNKKMFSTASITQIKPTNTVNHAGGAAYKLSDEHSLAQYVVTSCFNQTYYASAEEQLDKIKELAGQCRSEWVAKLAVYGHETAKMKDTPAYLLAVLAARIKAGESPALFNKVFPRVITNTKMLMNFVQIVRSGVTGRRSFGSAVKKTIQRWLESRTGNQLFTGSIGANPSFADIIKMVHPKPENDEKRNMYAWFVDKPFNVELLPPKMKAFEAFKVAKKDGRPGEIPEVPFQMLQTLNLTDEDWKSIGRNMPWNALRMNLNTLQRHGVFNDAKMIEHVTKTLSNPELVRKFNVFPYQLLSAYLNTTDVPVLVRNSLQDAMEIATENVPAFGLSTAVCVDTSGSMGSAVTGHRGTATSKVRCIDVAALFAASVCRRNPNTILLPFDTSVHNAACINPRDSIMTNATKLSKFGGGGTDVASAMRVLNGQVGTRPELIIYLSDNESWMNGRASYSRYGSTGLMQEWTNYKRKTPKAKMVLIDIQGSDNTQAPDNGKDVFNIGGFSDRVWPAIKSFVEYGEGNFTSIINEVSL